MFIANHSTPIFKVISIFDENTQLLIGGIIVILCVVVLIISPLFLKTNMTNEEIKQSLIFHYAEKEGNDMLHERGIHGYTIYSVTGGSWVSLEYHNLEEGCKILITLIWETDTFRLHNFVQVPL